MKKLIDVSYAQGTIDWKKVKNAGYDAAMIRATAYYPKSGKTGVDTHFHANAQNALAAGVKIGAYHYSYALTVQEAKLEAQHFLNTIKPYKLEYPAVLDFEDPSQTKLSKTLKADICTAFLETVEQAGYYAMLYSMASWLASELTDPRLSKYDKWVAHIGVSKPSYAGSYGIWQYSWTGKVDGITGNVDLNECYRDYPTIIKAAGLNLGQGKQEEPVPETVPKADYDALQAKFDGLVTGIQNVINEYK
jgi:lysozyme